MNEQLLRPSGGTPESSAALLERAAGRIEDGGWVRWHLQHPEGAGCCLLGAILVEAGPADAWPQGVSDPIGRMRAMKDGGGGRPGELAAAAVGKAAGVIRALSDGGPTAVPSGRPSSDEELVGWWNDHRIEDGPQAAALLRAAAAGGGGR